MLGSFGVVPRIRLAGVTACPLLAGSATAACRFLGCVRRVVPEGGMRWGQVAEML